MGIRFEVSVTLILGMALGYYAAKNFLINRGA